MDTGYKHGDFEVSGGLVIRPYINKHGRKNNEYLYPVKCIKTGKVQIPAFN